MTLRTRLLLLLLLLAFAFTATAPSTGATLTAVVFDAAAWSIPAPVHAAVAELRDAGHEIRLIDVDVTNGDDLPPVELRECLTAAKKHGLPALVFQSGSNVATADVPTDKDEFMRAVQ